MLEKTEHVLRAQFLTTFFTVVIFVVFTINLLLTLKLLLTLEKYKKVRFSEKVVSKLVDGDESTSIKVFKKPTKSILKASSYSREESTYSDDSDWLSSDDSELEITTDSDIDDYVTFQN